jgi:hypothetical protein
MLLPVFGVLVTVNMSANYGRFFFNDSFGVVDSKDDIHVWC